jgi:enamine deaminase RidA (YjgF/YER057c/UK114 family)
MSIERIPSSLPAPFSKAVRAGGFLFLSGVLAMDANGNILPGDIQTQTRAVLERIAQNLQECGSSMAQVVRATIWLSNLEDFAAFNEEYAKHFPQACLPAHACRQCSINRRKLKSKYRRG